jgi:hypothetical protein
MPSVFVQNVRTLKTPNVFMQHSPQNVDNVNKDVTYMTSNNFAVGGCYVLVMDKSLHISVLECVIVTVKIIVNGMFLRENTINNCGLFIS